jgi:hypothetical protein
MSGTSDDDLPPAFQVPLTAVEIRAITGILLDPTIDSGRHITAPVASVLLDKLIHAEEGA